MRAKMLFLAGLIVTWALTAFGGGAYTLAFKYKPGEVSKYKNTINMEVRSAAIPGGKMVMAEEYIETTKVLSVAADGTGEVEVTTSAFIQKVNGEKTPAGASMITGIPQDTPVIQTASRNGRILGTRLGKDLPEADKTKVEAALQNMKDRGIKLPEKPIRKGESWKREEIISNEVPGLGVIDISIAMQYTLAAEEKMLGLRCVRIAMVGSGSGMLGEGKGEIDIKLKGSLWLAVEEGKLVKVETEDNETMKLAGPDGQIEVIQVVSLVNELIP